MEIGTCKCGERREGTKIHDALFDDDRGGIGLDKTYQRVWPLVMAHSNGVPFLLFEAARRVVRAHASFIRSSTVSVSGQVSEAVPRSLSPGFPVFCPTAMLARHVSANVEAGTS
jgi:hypothetical protein